MTPAYHIQTFTGAQGEINREGESVPNIATSTDAIRVVIDPADHLLGEHTPLPSSIASGFLALGELVFSSCRYQSQHVTDPLGGPFGNLLSVPAEVASLLFS